MRIHKRRCGLYRTTGVLILGGRRKSILKGLSTYVKEHFTNAAYGAYPIEDDSKVAIVIVANKYSPNNFWYG